LHRDGEDDDADLLVPSARRGAAWSGGAMVKRMVAVRPFSPSFAHRKEKGERVEEGRWRRRGWKRARVCFGSKGI
jgi:hypothetical protein